jgi:glycosyltransferase involved in cell wall biosynthesis
VESTRIFNSEKTASPQDRQYRVLMIAPTSFFADYGCHVRILEEVRILQKFGCQVTICTYHNGRDLDDLHISRSCGIPWRTHYEVGSSRHKIAFDILLFGHALRLVQRLKPHIIHAHLHEGALIGSVLSRLWRVPMVFDYQGSLTSEMVDHRFLSPDGPFYTPMRKLENWIDAAAPHIMTSSQNAADLLIREFGCPQEKVTHVPDCVNTDTFAPIFSDENRLQLKQAWNIPPDRQVIVYLGLLAEYQGINHLLHAMRRVCDQREDVHLVVAGYPNIEYYRQVATELGLADRVTFTGRVRYEDAPRLLSIGDVAVSPKLSKTEGAGKLLNYMSMGLPTVAFDTQVSHEYLGPHGVYAATGDSEDLARCLYALLENRERRLALGSALRARAQELYSWESSARIILDIYAAMIGRIPARA